MRHSFFTRISAAWIALVLLLALFPSASAATSQFTDISRAAYPAYFDAINFVVDNGYMNGMSTTKFEPNTSLTRAMFITLLYRYDGSPTPIGSMPFEDVSASAYYYDAVRWGANEGIVTGMTDTLFNPNASVTREQVMTFLYRYSFTYRYDLVENIHASITGKADYSSVSEYARRPMQWAVSNGLTTTVGNQSYLYPKTVAQRKEVALWLCLYDQNVVGLKDGSDIYWFYNTGLFFTSGSANKYLITNAHINELVAHATNTSERALVIEESTNPWLGSCWGMTLTCILDQTGQLALNEMFVKDTSDMYSVPSPAAHNQLAHIMDKAKGSNQDISLVESAINYYHLSQYLNTVHGTNYSSRWVLNSANGYVLDDILDEQRDGGLLHLGINFYDTLQGHPGHAIVLTGIPYPDLTSNELAYWIEAYDPSIGMTRVRILPNIDQMQLLRNGQYVPLFAAKYCTDISRYNMIDLDGQWNDRNFAKQSLNALPDAETASVGGTWLYVNMGVPATITNAEGETIELSEGVISGTMKILETKDIYNGSDSPAICGILVNSSTAFSYECPDSVPSYTEFTVCGPTLFGGAYGIGIECVRVSTESTQVSGANMDIATYSSQGCPEDRYIRAVVEDESFFALSASPLDSTVSTTSHTGTGRISVVSNITCKVIGEYEVFPSQYLELRHFPSETVVVTNNPVEVNGVRKLQSQEGDRP